MNQVKKNYDCFVHLRKFPNIIDFLATLSLAFVPLNKPSNSKYCHNCVINIQFYIEERKGYVLEEMGFIVGQWESKHPATFNSFHHSHEWEYFCQLYLIHPFTQLDRFMQEAKFKSTLHKLELEHFMGKDNYIKAHISLLTISENVRKKLAYVRGIYCHFARDPLAPKKCTLKGLERKCIVLMKKLRSQFDDLIKAFKPLIGEEIDRIIIHHKHNNCFLSVDNNISENICHHRCNSESKDSE